MNFQLKRDVVSHPRSLDSLTKTSIVALVEDLMLIFMSTRRLGGGAVVGQYKVQ